MPPETPEILPQDLHRYVHIFLYYAVLQIAVIDFFRFRQITF